uniref:hypothetical protein n=1 Tax=Bacillus dicomae TaxID=3088378 RepID=UPI001F0D75DE|nr:hypothetical protein [Bacillus dicomae]
MLWKKGHLTISQTLSHDGKTFLVGGKTKSSVRKILLPATSTVAKQKKNRSVVLKAQLRQGEEYNDLVKSIQNEVEFLHNLFEIASKSGIEQIL